MPIELWTNNGISTLASSITNVATTLTVAASDGALFPNPTAGDWFYATLVGGGNVEIVKVTTRATDAFSVIVRAQQGTSAVAWPAGTQIGGRVTQQSLLDLQANVSEVLTINYVIGGAGVVLTTGIKGDVQIDFDCDIIQATMFADLSGSAVVDIWKDSYTNFPAVVGDSITAAAKPTISTAIKSQDTTLTGWTTAITAGDHLRYNVDSAATITRLTIALKVMRT